MTMRITVKNDDANRTATVTEETLSPGETPDTAHCVAADLGPGESKSYWIHAGKSLFVKEKEEASTPVERDGPGGGGSSGGGGGGGKP